MFVWRVAVPLPEHKLFRTVCPRYVKWNDMKRINMIIAAILMALSANAQIVTQGSLRELLGVRAMSVTFDFSKATVEGERMLDFLNNVYYEADYMPRFELDAREMLADFVEEFNDAEAPLILTVNPNVPMHMTVVPMEINRKGNSIRCDYVIRKSDGTQVAVIEMFTEEGRVGLFQNLMGDVFEEAGEAMGKFVKRTLKSEAKKAGKH